MAKLIIHLLLIIAFIDYTISSNHRGHGVDEDNLYELRSQVIKDYFLIWLNLN